MKQKGFIVLPIVIAVLVIAGIAFLLFNSFKQSKQTENISSLPTPTVSNKSTATPTTSTSSKDDDTSNWSNYEDPQKRYSFRYPKDQKIEKNQKSVGIYGLDFVLFEVKELTTSDSDPSTWWANQPENSPHGLPKDCYKQETVEIKGADKAIQVQNEGTNNDCLGPSFGKDVIVLYKNTLFIINYTDSLVGKEIYSSFKFQ